VSHLRITIAAFLALVFLALPSASVRGQPLCEIAPFQATPQATPIAFPPAAPEATPQAFPAASPEASPEAIPEASPIGRACQIQIIDFVFDPADVAVPAGTTVTWVNFGNRNHGVHFINADIDSGMIRPFTRFSYTFSTPGRYLYFNPFYPSEPWGTIDVS
jgi:plastocyanin